MPQWLQQALEKSQYFMPHGHCYLWIPWLLWLHVVSDVLIGLAYVGISLILWALVRRIRLPFSPVFVAFGLFIGLCGLTHFVAVWNVWKADYILSGIVKGATAAASVVTAIGLFRLRPQVEEVVHAARLSEERRIRLESTNAELEAMFAKVQELDRLKSQFFANVSHELRTPLTLILGPAERMLADDNLTVDQRRMLSSIEQNGHALLKQVNDLLDLARLESGKSELHYTGLDVAGWLRRTASQFDVAAEQRGLSLEVDAPDRIDAELDIDKVERVVVNLLANALKFTPTGGRVAVALQADDAWLRLDVSDTGPGIPAEQREVVFERFRQVEADSTRPHGGTGLGLAIVREFVELHGGRVSADEAAGGGARFVVTLPRHAPPGVVVTAAHPLDAAPQPTLDGVLHALRTDVDVDAGTAPHPFVAGRAQILLVEDNPEMRAFVAHTLADRYNVVTAADGREGLERAHALRPDLVITDIMMPRMSGDQLVAALREHADFSATPVLLLSARADDALRTRLLESGAQDYLVKPFQVAELRARVANLLAAKRAGDVLREELASLSTDLGELARQVSQKNRMLNTALQAAEVAREQAERASEVKTGFLAMVSHELRTPLATLHLNLQLFERDQALPPPMRPRVDRLLRSAQQMSALIEGLLQYTRLQSGRLQHNVQPIDLAALAAALVDEYAPSAQAGVELQLAMPPADLPLLHGDADLVRVVIGNLLSNALKFTARGSVTLRLDADEDGHVIEVRDTGSGIPVADLERIFEPFEQLEPVRRKSLPGIGLGLSLVKQIVTGLGGGIHVDSTPDSGSMFTVRLPYGEARKPA